MFGKAITFGLAIVVILALFSLASCGGAALLATEDPPVELMVTGIADGQTISPPLGMANIRAMASADAGIKSIQIYVDGADETPNDIDPLVRGLEYVWTYSGAGDHTIEVVAEDNAGNQISDSRTVHLEF